MNNASTADKVHALRVEYAVWNQVEVVCGAIRDDDGQHCGHLVRGGKIILPFPSSAYMAPTTSVALAGMVMLA